MWRNHHLPWKIWMLKHKSAPQKEKPRYVEDFYKDKLIRKKPALSCRRLRSRKKSPICHIKMVDFPLLCMLNGSVSVPMAHGPMAKNTQRIDHLKTCPNTWVVGCEKSHLFHGNVTSCGLKKHIYTNTHIYIYI